MSGGNPEQVMYNNLNKLVFKNRADFEDFMDTGDMSKIKSNGKFGFLHLLTETAHEHYELFIRLIRRPDININLRTSFGETALMIATRSTNYESVEMADTLNELLRVPGIDLNLQNEYGRTALMNLMEFDSNQNLDILQTLLNHPDLDVNMQDEYYSTALITGVSYLEYSNNKEGIKILLQHPNIDVTLQDEDGNSAYDILYDALYIDGESIFSPDSPMGQNYELLDLLKFDEIEHEQHISHGMSPVFPLQMSPQNPATPVEDSEEFPVINIDTNKVIPFFDPIMQEEENIKIGDYLSEDPDNIVIVHGDNHDDYFFTKHSVINSLRNSGVYPCKNANGIMNPNNIISQINLFKIRSIGLIVNTEYVNVDRIYTNPDHQIFVLFKSEDSYPAYISKEVHDNPGTSIVSALHCQDGYGSNIGKIALGFETTVGGRRKRKKVNKRVKSRRTKNKRKQLSKKTKKRMRRRN